MLVRVWCSSPDQKRKKEKGKKKKWKPKSFKQQSSVDCLDGEKETEEEANESETEKEEEEERRGEEGGRWGCFWMRRRQPAHAAWYSWCNLCATVIECTARWTGCPADPPTHTRLQWDVVGVFFFAVVFLCFFISWMCASNVHFPNPLCDYTLNYKKYIAVFVHKSLFFPHLHQRLLSSGCCSCFFFSFTYLFIMWLNVQIIDFV